ncbi:zinc metalloproteinase nas-4-like isoform X1 [Ctenocephalides felis]|uniref:zinc metalloproteinase nas-4-like isoform X1 n=1 Tax=Ctenocephalides felis TaxID=7515 RepID=UPI000E6E1411|nr:zinc metalloproteinase nas-4-like isoform X1 [Ctenocephalides felis]
MLIPRPAGRNGIRAKSARWPNGVIPFEIKGNFNAHEMDLIERALNDYKTKTCIKFVPRMGEPDYISIRSDGSGCWSSVGRIGGEQVVNLQSPGCTTKKGTVIHELMHAVGFTHEQNRAERDNYVSIRWSNIRSGVESNFEKVEASEYYGFGVPYDYRSVMHYSANAFSVNGQPTIVAKNSQDNSKMGQREGFSSGDIRKIRQMYNCRNL